MCLTGRFFFSFLGAPDSQLSILSKMPNVEVLSLSINEVTTLRYFQSCTKLRELYLRRNQLANMNEIKHLAELSELKVALSKRFEM